MAIYLKSKRDYALSGPFLSGEVGEGGDIIVQEVIISSEGRHVVGVRMLGVSFGSPWKTRYLSPLQGMGARDDYGTVKLFQ